MAVMAYRTNQSLSSPLLGTEEPPASEAWNIELKCCCKDDMENTNRDLERRLRLRKEG